MPNSYHRATDTKNPSLHCCLAKSVDNWKELSSFILDIFSNFSIRNQGELERTETTKNFC